MVMDIIVDKSTGYIVNPETLTEGANLDFLNNFKNFDGEIVIPPHLEVIEINETRSDPDRAYHYKHYYYINKVVECRYILSTELVNSEIVNLKQELSNTDYIIQKAYEYFLVGLETEYDMDEVHAERQAIRDKINELEELLNQEGGVM
nr:MAG TPA: hypothetical protein [Caudoviricetes sp.]